MKCIYVGVSLSKLQSFFWKISLNSRLIRLEGFNNKISPILLCVQRGLVIKRYPGASKAPRSNPCKTFFSSLLFFSFVLFFFFFFSFSFHVCYVSTYSLQFLDLQIFFSALLAVPPKSFARSCDLRISSLKGIRLGCHGGCLKSKRLLKLALFADSALRALECNININKVNV